MIETEKREINVEEFTKYRDILDDMIRSFELLDINKKVKRIFTDKMMEVSVWLSVKISEMKRSKNSNILPL